MIRILVRALVLGAMLTGAGAGARANSFAPAPRFLNYIGPPVTQIVVNKSDRKLFLISGRTILRAYKVGLGPQPTGPKRYQGDGRTPEGIYFIDRANPNSDYHLSLRISYPDATDRAKAMMLGQDPGGAIMIHGRGAYGNAQTKRDWTAGCIAVSDAEIEEIFAMVRPGVPIVIYP